jgi:hypothetical protein
MAHCRNCETPLEPDYGYCPQCGQKNVDLERPISELLGEAVRETADIDGRALRTLWTLIRHPGVLTSEFLAGRRRLYSPPVRLYLVISVGFFLLASWVAGQGMLLIEGQTLEADAAGQARLFAEYVPRLMFVLLPVFALVLKVAFRQRFYFDHLVHALHLHSAAYLVLALMLPLEQAAANSLTAKVIQLLLFIYLLASFVTSLRRVYAVGWPVAAAKALGVLLGYMMLVAGSLEAASYLAMPESTSTPYLTD